VSKRIIIVDDERHSREGLRDSLVLEGYRVETASDGWQAIHKIKDGRYQLAIINLDLRPFQGVDIDGWDLVRIFRAYSAGIALIVMGADEGLRLRQRAEELGVAEILEKPVSLARLKELVRDLPRSLSPESAVAGGQQVKN